MIPQGSALSNYDGWTPVADTWVTNGVATPSYTIKVTGDATDRYWEGLKVSFQQVQPLSAYWDFTTGVNSLVGSYNCVGTGVTVTTGMFGRNAIVGDGSTNRKITVDNNAGLVATADFTLGFWVSYSNTGVVKGIYSSALWTTIFKGFRVYINASNQIAIDIGDGVSVYNLATAKTFGDGSFKYVVICFRNSRFTIYVNGEVELKNDFNTPIASHTYPIKIGCLINNSAVDYVFMNGLICDVFFINGLALDQKTIKDKYVSATQQGSASLTLTKYGVIVYPPYTVSGYTNLLLYMGTDYTGVATAITNPKVSSNRAPKGFPVSSAKWTERYASYGTVTQASPVASTYYNMGGISLIAPVGKWDMRIQWCSYSGPTSAVSSMLTGISTLLTGMSDIELSDYAYSNYGGVTLAGTNRSRPGVVVPTPTNYYLLAVTQAVSSNMYLYGPIGGIIIEFKCAHI